MFEDAQMILSYASPYKVTMNLERENKAPSSRVTNKKNKLNKRALGSDSYQRTMLHPLYKTRSVDNLIKIGRHDKQPNYGTADVPDSQALHSSNAYGRMLSKFKQQIITYLGSSTKAENVDHDQHHHVQQAATFTTDSEIPEKKAPSNLMRPLTSIQNLFKPNRLNWPEEYSNNGQNNNLNSVVVGNSLALGNPGFLDDDETDEFRKEYQLSQLKYQQQFSVPALKQPNSHALRHQNSLQAAAHYNRASQPTNLIKYHQQTMTDLSQVDSMHPMNQFVNVNLNDLNQLKGARHDERFDEMDYTNSVRKGNSTTQLNNLNKSLTSSSQFISVPLTLADESTSEQQQTNRQPNTTVAEVHAAVDRSPVDTQNKSLPRIDSESKSVNKPRSSSMNDLPNQSTVSMNPEEPIGNSASDNHQSTLERAISLDFSNQTDQNTMMNSKLSKSVFTSKFSKQPDDHPSRHRRLIKTKNQTNLNQQQKQSSSLSDITYEQSLSSLSNGKLSNPSKSIRNSLSSTNSTCSSPSLPSGSSDTKMEYDDHSILMLKSSPEESNSILTRENRLEFEQTNSSDHSRLDDELDGKESILFVSDQHRVNAMIDGHQQTSRDQSISDDHLFASKEQAKKIIGDVFTMHSIRTLNAIKSDKQLNDLFRSNKETNESTDQRETSSRPKSTRDMNKDIIPNISNFKISSTKKEIPTRISSLTAASDHLSTNPFSNPFSSNVPSRDNLFANSARDQSLNKENDQQQNRPDSSSSITDDEIAQLKNRVSKLKKEFSLRQKEIETQNKQSSVNKFRRPSTGQQHANAKKVLSENRPGNRPPTGSISKKQEQILNSTTIDFESWSWNQDS